jgi:hypothetical protein
MSTYIEVWFPHYREEGRGMVKPTFFLSPPFPSKKPERDIRTTDSVPPPAKH